MLKTVKKRVAGAMIHYLSDWKAGEKKVRDEVSCNRQLLLMERARTFENWE